MPLASNATDADLVARAQQSARDDYGAFDALAQRYQDRVLGNCRYLTVARDDADDMAQEVFVKAFFALSKFEGRSSFQTWLWRIKVNHCLNHLRRSRRERTIDIEAPGLDRVPELQVEATAHRTLQTQLDRELIDQTLDALPETLRVPLLLRDLDGLSYQEIADELGLSLSAVKMRIKRGREEFRHRYDEHVSGAEPRAGQMRADG